MLHNFSISGGILCEKKKVGSTLKPSTHNTNTTAENTEGRLPITESRPNPIAREEQKRA